MFNLSLLGHKNKKSWVFAKHGYSHLEMCAFGLFLYIFMVIVLFFLVDLVINKSPDKSTLIIILDLIRNSN